MSSGNFIDDERFDGLYLNVAQTTRGIDPLLHTLFSFLRRKTDFFDEKGTDVAVQKVNEILQQHVEIHQKNREKKKTKKTPPKKKTAPKKVPEPVLEMASDGGFDVSQAEPAKETPPVAVAAVAAATVAAAVAAAVATKQDAAVAPEAEKVEAVEPVEKQAAVATTNTEASDKANAGDDDDGKPPPPVGNGGTVQQKYVWTQTLAEVNVILSVPENTRGRDLNVTVAKTHLKVGLRSQPGTWIVDAPLTKSIICDDSFWTVEDGSRLCMNLQKSNQMEWWDSVCQDDPKIDVKTIQPESSSVSDLDGETRKTVEKMMYDQRQKALGLPSSDEEQKAGMFEKFKQQHPELDFSNAKMS